MFEKVHMNDLGNYRPISILPLVSKIFENKKIYHQIYDYLYENDVLNTFYSGFQSYALHSNFANSATWDNEQLLNYH